MWRRREQLRTYYNILGVNNQSSTQEIKKSFRKRAKELHPDLRSSSYSGNDITDGEMRLLLKAYEVLSDPIKRERYDRNLVFRQAQKTRRFDYREFLQRKKNDFFSLSKLILFDLLHSYNEEALNLYSKLESRPHFQLKNFLNREDYMDCTFLLAEQLCEAGDYLKAFGLFKCVYEEEMKSPYFKHFIDEVMDRLKRIACFQLIGLVSPFDSIQYIKELLDFDLSRKDKALLYKKIAEVYICIGNRRLAMEFLKKGLQFNSKLAGIKKLREKIEQPEIRV